MAPHCQSLHCVQKKNTHSHFLSYLHELFVDLNKNCSEYTQGLIDSENVKKLCINLLSPILVILCELNCAAVEVYAVTLWRPCCTSIPRQLDSDPLPVIRLSLADKPINNSCRGSVAWSLSPRNFLVIVAFLLARHRGTRSQLEAVPPYSIRLRVILVQSAAWALHVRPALALGDSLDC